MPNINQNSIQNHNGKDLKDKKAKELRQQTIVGIVVVVILLGMIAAIGITALNANNMENQKKIEQAQQARRAVKKLTTNQKPKYANNEGGILISKTGMEQQLRMLQPLQFMLIHYALGAVILIAIPIKCLLP